MASDRPLIAVLRPAGPVGSGAKAYFCLAPSPMYVPIAHEPATVYAPSPASITASRLSVDCLSNLGA
jgi:hypothetical protein